MDFKKKLWKKFLIILILLIIYLPGFVRILRLSHHKRELEEKVRLLRKENEELAKEIYKLQHDPTYIEKVAREELKLGKDGEIIYKIYPEKE